MDNEPIFSDKDLVFKYTSQQAEDDGILFDVTNVNPDWKKGLFNYVTTNLLNQGYFKSDSNIYIPNLLDLLNQSQQIVRQESQNFTKEDTFYSGKIELPKGTKQQIFIVLNETGKFTIMLPEDY